MLPNTTQGKREIFIQTIFYAIRKGVCPHPPKLYP
uniref:Uncharacterized protein n=1 Tax=Podoviridae sp. ctzXp5 TaxID=2827758 RepID=A0A8S5TDZ1_9CAUD|nr:MAG TPA: hypothetical protein [Podoviridae sp. ctzXp5]